VNGLMRPLHLPPNELPINPRWQKLDRPDLIKAVSGPGATSSDKLIAFLQAAQAHLNAKELDRSTVNFNAVETPLISMRFQIKPGELGHLTSSELADTLPPFVAAAPGTNAIAAAYGNG
jgi:hypothetical protein